MLRPTIPTLAGLLLAALVGASGCASLGSGTSVFRGQDPMDLLTAAENADAPPPVDAAPAAEAPMAEAPMADDPAADQQQTAQAEQTYTQEEYCPPGGFCRPGGQFPIVVYPRGGYCRPGYGCGNHLDWYPKHHLSYSYTTPRNLSYPTQGCPSGTVTYPYYTLKGPSDFFRQ